MMLNAIAHLNWLAVALAIVANFIVGGIWFPLVVRRAYVAALGREMTSGAHSLIGPLVCLTITTITSAILIRLLGVNTQAGAIAFGALVGFGYLTPTTVNIALNLLFPRPFLYSLINAPYFVAGSMLVSSILVAMK